MLKQIDHIGIMVRDLDRALEKYERVFRAKATHTEVNKELSRRFAFVPVGGVMLELVQPLVQGEGQAGPPLQEQSEGFTHIAYRVDNLDEMLAEMKEKGVRLRNERPRPGTRGSRIAFISPEETNNVSIEFVELDE